MGSYLDFAFTPPPLAPLDPEALAFKIRKFSNAWSHRSYLDMLRSVLRYRHSSSRHFAAELVAAEHRRKSFLTARYRHTRSHRAVHNPCRRRRRDVALLNKLWLTYHGLQGAFQHLVEHSGLNIHAGNEQTVPSASLTKTCSPRRSDI